jgi:adenylate cyclase
MTERASSARSISEPFPLKARFRRRLVPGLLAFVGISLLIIGGTARFAVEAIYLELAQRRAQTIERSISDSSNVAWNTLMSGASMDELRKSDVAQQLTGAFASEVRQQNLLELKVYDLNRKVLFATHLDEIGTTENGTALRDVIADAKSGIVKKKLPDDTEQYELYVPVFDESGALRVVFELYEPVDYLNTILLRSAVPIIVIPGFLFLVLGFTLDKLVGAAQSDINTRTEVINMLRERLESFVSKSAVHAAHDVDASSEITSQRIITTVFFSDIRDFTGFSEQNTTESVISFLNDLMTLQVAILKQHEGDVDKMIGDAILARFDGEDGAKRAVAAAREIQTAIRQAEFPRSIGIGIYQGEVIAGTIGPDDRRDFTIIGDTVNVAARLCSAAAANEIVVESSLADDHFLPEETVAVKGRETPVSIRRDRIIGQS